MSLINWSSLIVVVAALLALQASAVSAIYDSELRDGYVKLEKYLAKNSNNATDIDSIIKLIRGWPEESSLSLTMSRDTKKQIMYWVVELTSLTKGRSMCNEKGYKIVRDNMRLSKGLPRLRQLVRHYVTKNAEYCEPIFAHLAAVNREDGVDRDSRLPWLNFTERMVEQLTGWKYDNYSRFLKHTIDDDDDQNASVNLYDFIQTTFRNNPKQVNVGQMMVDTMEQFDVTKCWSYKDRYETRWFNERQDFLWRMLRYIVWPCSNFVAQMNSERRFQLATVHSRILKRNLRFESKPEINSTSSWNLVVFYWNWHRFEICRNFVVHSKPEIYKTIERMRAKEYGYDPEEGIRNLRYDKSVNIIFPTDKDYDEPHDLFEPNE